MLTMTSTYYHILLPKKNPMTISIPSIQNRLICIQFYTNTELNDTFQKPAKKINITIKSVGCVSLSLQIRKRKKERKKKRISLTKRECMQSPCNLIVPQTNNPYCFNEQDHPDVKITIPEVRKCKYHPNQRKRRFYLPKMKFIQGHRNS